MAYPYSPVATGKTNSTTMSTDHPSHHNAMAAALNDLLTELGTNPRGTYASLTQRLLDGAANQTISAHFIFRNPVDIGTLTLPLSAPGLLVVLAGQVDPGENGLYVSEVGGTIDAGSRVDIFNFGHLGWTVSSTYVANDLLPLFAIVDPGLYDGSNVLGSVDFRITTYDGVEYFLKSEVLDHETIQNMIGRVFPPAMGDYVISEDSDLTINHAVVVCNGQTEEFTITLGPYATIVRPVFIWNKGDYTVSLVNNPIDIAFSYDLDPGERVLILPDQNAWNVYHLLPDPDSVSDKNKVVRVSSDGTSYSLSNSGPCSLASFAWQGSHPDGVLQVEWLLQNEESPDISWSASVNPERISGLSPGMYRFSIVSVWASNSSGYRALTAKYRSPGGVTESILGPTANAVSGTTTNLSYTMTIAMEAGGSLLVELDQNTGGTLTGTTVVASVEYLGPLAE
jgi:hypothetical protein